jgi:hypothetical protein
MNVQGSRVGARGGRKNFCQNGSAFDRRPRAPTRIREGLFDGVIVADPTINQSGGMLCSLRSGIIEEQELVQF